MIGSANRLGAFHPEINCYINVETSMIKIGHLFCCHFFSDLCSLGLVLISMLSGLDNVLFLVGAVLSATLICFSFNEKKLSSCHQTEHTAAATLTSLFPGWQRLPCD